MFGAIFNSYEATEITEDTEKRIRMVVVPRFLGELCVLGGFAFRRFALVLRVAGLRAVFGHRGFHRGGAEGARNGHEEAQNCTKSDLLSW